MNPRPAIPREAPLLLTLKPSKRLSAWLKIVHGLALAASVANALPVFVQGFVCVAIAVHYRFAVIRSLPCHTLRYSEATGWQLAGSGDFVDTQILAASVLTTFALFLRIEMQPAHTHISGSVALNRLPGKAVKNLLIVSDMLDDDDYRGLVVKLRTTYKVKGKPSNLIKSA
jgi:toxin CptA